MSDDSFEKARRRMLDAIADDAARTADYTGRSRFSDAVMAAIAAVPRHEFVAPGDEIAAYVNRPRPIGHGQTISQPYIVALMTDLLDLGGTERVLEVGTGSGYQAAVLASLANEIFSIEIVEALGEAARRRLTRLGYGNIQIRIGDGYQGWPEAAPFDAIIVTAAPPRIPDALTRQLKPGGRMVLPIGRAADHQNLTLVRKDDSGQITITDVLPVAFVPMLPGKSAG